MLVSKSCIRSFIPVISVCINNVCVCIHTHTHTHTFTHTDSYADLTDVVWNSFGAHSGQQEKDLSQRFFLRVIEHTLHCLCMHTCMHPHTYACTHPHSCIHTPTLMHSHPPCMHTHPLMHAHTRLTSKWASDMQHVEYKLLDSALILLSAVKYVCVCVCA